MRHHVAAHTSIKAIRFITNYLLPPPKRAVLAHLGIPLATGETVKDEDRVPIVRKAEVDVSPASQNLFDARENRVTCAEPSKPVWVQRIWRKRAGLLASCEQLVELCPLHQSILTPPLLLS